MKSSYDGYRAQVHVDRGRIRVFTRNGYDWTKKPAGSPEWPDFRKRKYTTDPASGEYVDGKVRFSGAEAFRQKYQLAAKLGVKSIAFWYCGSEDPKIWDMLPTRR